MDQAEQVEAWRHLWSIGDYPRLGDLWAEAGQWLVDDLDDRLGLAGSSLVDVACGHGTTAIAAARRGASVVGVDLTPRLLDEARRRATAAGVDVEFVEGDFHDLPLGNAVADVVTSTFGVFLSTRPDRAAQELARVVAPGGHVAVTAWATDASPGDMIAAIAEVRHIEPAEVLAGRPDTTAWGHPDALADLFDGTDVEVVSVTRHEVVVPTDDVEDLLAVFMSTSGPWMQAREALVDDGVSWPDVERALVARWRARLTADGLPLAHTRALLRRG